MTGNEDLALRIARAVLDAIGLETIEVSDIFPAILLELERPDEPSPGY